MRRFGGRRLVDRVEASGADIEGLVCEPGVDVLSAEDDAAADLAAESAGCSSLVPRGVDGRGRGAEILRKLLDVEIGTGGGGLFQCGPPLGRDVLSLHRRPREARPPSEMDTLECEILNLTLVITAV